MRSCRLPVYFGLYTALYRRSSVFLGIVASAGDRPVAVISLMTAPPWRR